MVSLKKESNEFSTYFFLAFLFVDTGHSPLDGKDFTVDGINGFGGKKKKKKRRHSRTIFTSYQLDELEKAFKGMYCIFFSFLICAKKPPIEIEIWISTFSHQLFFFI